MHLKTITRTTTITILLALLFTACERERPPTKTLMEGTWEVTEAYNDNGDTITSDINFPITAFHLSSDNGIVSTAGPMFMHIVYGDSKYVQIASKIDKVFDYASLDFNNGEWFIEGGSDVERFTIEMKLEGLPGQKSLTELLDALGVTQDYLDVVVYHKFMDVHVTFPNENESGFGGNDDEEFETMVWEFDTETFAEYNTKDKYGDKVLWEGWPVDKFCRCKYVLQKRSKDLEEIVKEHK